VKPETIDLGLWTLDCKTRTLNPVSDLSRYDRQMRFAPLGEQAQRRLLNSRALVCGCGALGTVIANTLVRAGVGHLRIIDRDFIELNNLQRQVLFDEDDLAAQLPKAVAAAEKLRRINSSIEVEGIVSDVNHTNILEHCDGVDVIVDGTDNFETRFLINDAAHKLGIPWVYGGCIASEGQSMTIIPGETPCLRCLIPEPPPPGSTPTCDTAGILGSIVNVVASVQACEAIKLLAGKRDAVNRGLSIIDLWDNQFRLVRLDQLRDQGGCSTCRDAEYPWLSGERMSQTAVLCGRNAVQLRSTGGAVSLEELEAKLRGMSDVIRNRFLLRATIDGYSLTVFPDGRAIIGGTDDTTVARSVYAKYIGS
jgi:molybdopterin/thiamine biosynthesis adenylyltransferase